jgi:hypothetical protein
MFASSTFQDVSLNQWLLVQAHLGFDTATLAKIPAEKMGVM